MRALAFALALVVAVWSLALAAAPPDFSAAQQSFDEKSYLPALQGFQDFLKAHPDSPQRDQARYEIAECYLKLRKPEDAGKWLQQFVASAPDSEWKTRAWLLMARHYSDLEMPRYDQVAVCARIADCYSKAIPRLSGDELQTALLERAAQYAQCQYNDSASMQRAFADWERVATLDPHGENGAHALWDQAEQQRGQPSPPQHPEQARNNALATWRRLIAAMPHTTYAPRAQFAIAQDCNNHQDYQRALDEYQRVVDDYPSNDLAKQARSARQEILEPRLETTVQRVFHPGEKATLDTRIRNIGKVHFRAWSIDLIAALQQVRSLDLVPTEWKPTGAPAAEWDVDPKDSGNHDWHTVTTTAPLQDSGAYLVVGEGADKKTSSLLLVSRLAAITKWGRGRGLVYVADAQSGTPVATAAVVAASKFTYHKERKNSIYDKIEAGTTDPSGTYDLTFDDTEYNGLVIAGHGHDFALSTSQYYWYSGADDDNQRDMYFYTDRPVYRPQQKVSWKAIIRGLHDEQYVVRAHEQYKVTIYSPRSDKLLDKDFEASDMGTIDGSVDLPAGAALGAYRVDIVQASMPFAKSQPSPHEFTFRVEEYKKPEFEVDISSDRPHYLVGDTAALTIEGKYYFGEPVAHGQVTYTVTRTPFAPWFSQWGQYPWFDIEEASMGRGDFEGRMMGRAYGRVAQPMYGGYYGYGAPETVATGHAMLDEHGKFVLHVPAKGARKQVGNAKLPITDPNIAWTYNVEAHVVDSSRRDISGALSYHSAQKPGFIFAFPQRYIYAAGDDVRIDVHVRDVDSQPLAAGLEAVVEKGVWVAGNTVATRQAAHVDWQHVASNALSVDKSGDATFAWKAPQSAMYRVRFVAAKNEFSGETQFQVGVETDSRFYKFSGLDIITDKQMYRAGDYATIVLNCEKENSDVLVTLEAESIARRMVVHCPTKSTMVRIPIGADLEPNVWIHAMTVHDYKVLQADKQVFVPPVERTLNVVVKPLKDTYKPGESGQIEVDVTDVNQKPVEAEISLGTTDASLYYIQADDTPSIEKHFYGQKKQRTVSTTTSFDFRSQGVEEQEKTAPKKMGVAMEMQNAAAAPAPMAAGGMARAKAARDEAAPANPFTGLVPPGTIAPARVRSNFADTAIWVAAAKTDASGKAVVTVPFPDSLTRWRTTVRALGADTHVGDATADVTTKKNIMVRLESPRFFVEKDQVVLGAQVHNLLPDAKKIKVKIEAPGLQIDGPAEQDVDVKPGQQVHVDFKATVQPPGIGKGLGEYTKCPILLSALTDQESDAVKQEIPILPHGAERYEYKAGEVGNDASFTLHIPEQRRASSSLLYVTMSPSLAGTIVDTLDYLVAYPYGCVEQTMSRFVPASIAAKALHDLHQDDDDLTQRLPDVQKAGLDRLASFQHADGGWGWWQHDRTDAYMTAYVIYGLTLAKSSISVDEAMLSRGIGYLTGHLKDLEQDRNNLAYALYALSFSKHAPSKYLEGLFAMRDDLNDYSKFLLLIALHNSGRDQQAQVLLRNLNDFVRVDKQNNTASWAGDGVPYFWWQDGVETTATALQAYMMLDPKNEKVEQMVRWLVYNRRGDRWKSTRDSALCVLALTEYLKQTDQLDPDFGYDILINDKVVKSGKITRDKLYSADNTLLLTGDQVPSGDVRVSIKRYTRGGGGTAYYEAAASFFSTEENIPAGGNEVLVRRNYQRVQRAGQATAGKPELLSDGVQLTSGDVIEADLDIEAKNNYQYLAFEDMKPAGCEPLELKSGETYGDGFCSNLELRDEKVVFFVGWLAQGKHHVSYRMRCETPGQFHVLPTEGYAMYVPEVKSNSAEFHLGIKDATTGVTLR